MRCRGKTCAKKSDDSKNQWMNERGKVFLALRQKRESQRAWINCLEFKRKLALNPDCAPIHRAFWKRARDARYFPDEMQIFLQASKNVWAEGRGCRRGEERRTLSVSIVDIGRFGFLAQNVNLTDYVYNLNTEHGFINNFSHFGESLREVSASFPLHARC